MKISDLHRARLRRARQAVEKHRADIEVADAMIWGTRRDLDRARTFLRACELTPILRKNESKRERAARALAASEQKVAALERLLGPEAAAEPIDDPYAGWQIGAQPGEYRGLVSVDGTRVECWYCSSVNAIRVNACVVRLTRNETTIGFGFGYYHSEQHTLVPIPRCGECMRRQEDHRRAQRLENWAQLVSVLGAIVAGLVAIFHGDTVVRVGAAAVVICLIAVFVGAICYSSGRRRDYVREAMARPTRPTVLYPPLQELIDYGWHIGPDTPP